MPYIQGDAKKRELLKCVVAAMFNWQHCGTGTLSYRQPRHLVIMDQWNGQQRAFAIKMFQFLLGFSKVLVFFVSPCTTKYGLMRKASGTFVAGAADQNYTCGGTFSINCKEFTVLLIIKILSIFMWKNVTSIRLRTVCFNTDTLFCSCILHIKACFVWDYSDCTTLPYLTCIFGLNKHQELKKKNCGQW